MTKDPVYTFPGKAIMITLLLAAVAVAYFNILSAPFSSWDDKEYVVRNADIQGMGWEHISAWFTRFYVGNYHPLTMLSYAIDHAIGMQDPYIYHLTNITIHAANSSILLLLVSRIFGNNIVGFFTALIFALHPSQTESVSWIAERKTVLCALFYLLAMRQYVAYIARPTALRLFAVFLLGICAMLSKGIAVTLPLGLFVIDIFMARQVSIRQSLQEKGPLFIAAIATGIIAIRAQAAGNFLGIHNDYTLWDKIVLAGFAYSRYIIHFLVPTHLSVIYPYPDSIGLLQYAGLAAAAGMMVLLFIAWKRNWHVLTGSIIFYTVNIALVLQFVQFGEYLMADRYLYIAGIGIIIPLVYYPATLLKGSTSKAIGYTAYGSIGIVLLFATFIRNGIWQSDISFMSSILKEFPNSAIAEYSVGSLYLHNGNYAEAEPHINNAVKLAPRNHIAWFNKGVLLLRLGNTDGSLQAFNTCLSLHPYTEAYFSRALLYMGLGKYTEAISDAERTLAKQPGNARAWYIKANSTEQNGDFTTAVACYTQALQFEQNDPLFYLGRGRAYTRLQQSAPALNDLNMAIAMSPSLGEAYYCRGVLQYYAGKDPCSEFRKAGDHGYQVPADIKQKLCPGMGR
jgi:tetratricopeptide (TPR) repeat protein